MRRDRFDSEEWTVRVEGTHRLVSTTALRIRRYEEYLLDLFANGLLRGTIHTAIGQELPTAALGSYAHEEDWVFSNHRCHGHYLAHGGDPVGLLRELVGRRDGVTAGLGGSQHIVTPRFMSGGILGALLPAAVGVAQSVADGAVVIAYTGDGAFGEGATYEALNYLGVRGGAFLLLIETNGIAQSTSVSSTISGGFEEKARAFSLPYQKVSQYSWPRICEDLGEAIEQVRRGREPLLVEVETFRLGPHSKGDDTRTESELSPWREKDPLNRMLETGSLGPEDCEEAEKWLRQIADAAGLPEPDSLRRSRLRVRRRTWSGLLHEPQLYADLVYRALDSLLSNDDRVVVLGEDVEGPYGGAFGITRDLSTKYPGRVINTPISESLLCGLAHGASLAGKVPVVEIMFGDFLTLCVDQILNQLLKTSLLRRTGGLPVIIRTPMGGRRGYGPTHSQSLETLLAGHTGLDIVSLNSCVDPGSVYMKAVELGTPTVVCEHKILYNRPAAPELPAGYAVSRQEAEGYPVICLLPAGGESSCTVACFGDGFDLAKEAIVRLFVEHEILVDVVCPTKIWPLDVRQIVESVERTGKIVSFEEGSSFYGFGAEVVAACVEQGCKFEAMRLGNSDLIPAAVELERQILPGVNDLVSAVVRMVRVEPEGRRDGGAAE